MKHERYRPTPLPPASGAQIIPVCLDCGALVWNLKAHNQFHWKLDPAGELAVGDEVYIRSWGIGTDDGRTICQKAPVISVLANCLQIPSREGHVPYLFRFDEVFPASERYGFDPYWKDR
jgi:hypothetical protein